MWVLVGSTNGLLCEQPKKEELNTHTHEDTQQHHTYRCLVLASSMPAVTHANNGSASNERVTANTAVDSSKTISCLHLCLMICCVDNNRCVCVCVFVDVPLQPPG